MAIELYTLDQYAEMMKANKPYLMALEELVEAIDYGQIEVILDVRSKAVEKMIVVNRKTWLRPKAGHNRSGFAIEKEEKVRATFNI
jgi:hypothetical protein